MGGWARLSARLRDALLWTEVSLVVKTVVAAVIAWLLAGHLFGVAQPFLAPWAALLTVNATVYRTFARGLQQVAAAVLGVLLAFAAGSLLGVGVVSLGLMLLVAMAVGRTRAGARGDDRCRNRARRAARRLQLPA